MKTLERRIYTQAEGTQNNIVVELFAGESLIPYCCKMMENNSIPGLLPVRHQMLDGVYILKYNVSGKLRLQDYLMQKRLSYERGLILLRNLTDSLLQLGEYFLSAKQCVLNPQQIYIGDGMRTYLICLPLEEETNADMTETLQNFYEKLLSNYFATAECSDYDEMFKWVYRADPFDLVAFRDRFLVSPVKNQEPSPKEAKPVLRDIPRATSYASENLPADMSKEQKGSETKLISADNSAKAGVLNIPGGGSIAVPEAPASNKKPKKEKEEKKPKSAKEKKGFWPFGSRSADQNNSKQEKSKEKELAVPQEARVQHQKEEAALDDWEDGTIYVAEEDRTVFAGNEPSRCYLTYRGEKIAITKSPFVIGKHTASMQIDYAIYNNNNISRKHASVLMQGSTYVLQDNHSLNGTFLNGKRLTPEQTLPLKDGDEIRLYNEVFVFHLD